MKLKNLAAIRARISREMAKVSGALQCQRALGGWKEREKYKCGDLELVRIVDHEEQQLRSYVVKLVVLQEAVNRNWLVRQFVKLASRKIANALDALGPIL